MMSTQLLLNISYIVIILMLAVYGKKIKAKFFPSKEDKNDSFAFSEISNSYREVPLDHRLPTYENNSFELEDILKTRLDHKIGLNLNFESRKANLKAGDLVKLTFQIVGVDENGEETYDVENMWVIIEKIEGAFISGILDNDPFCTDNLKSGYKFWFHKNHILEFYNGN